MLLPGFTSFAASMLIETNGNSAQPLSIALDGMVNEEMGWTLPSSGWNQTS
jgi:hypothetical protein